MMNPAISGVKKREGCSCFRFIIFFSCLIRSFTHKIVIAFILLFQLDCRAQHAYWIVPQDTYDLPALMEEMKDAGIEIRVHSEWLNAFSVSLGKHNLDHLKGLSYNFTITPVLRLKANTVFTDGRLLYSKALEQMQAEAFTARGISGLGVKIGVTDAGYLYLDDTAKAADLAHLWKGKQIVATKDFVKSIDTVSFVETFYTGRKKPLKERTNWLRKAIRDMKLIYHYHGTEVMRMIAGYDPTPDYHRGLATASLFYLARTEDGRREFKEEEDYYVAALEWMQKQGVRLVNTSLGYGRGRRLKGANYKPTDMNGSSMIAKAVDIACNEKNMLVVVAAGNDGDKGRWKVINTPADAAAALSVGAVLNRLEKADYSGVGPAFNSYLKPEVAAFSTQGTSLSAPAVCGFAACLLELNPELTSAELKDIIIRSSHLYPYGNNYIGYGVPLASRALELLKDINFQFTHTKELHLKGNEYLFEIAKKNIPYISVFHKKDATNVINNAVLFSSKDSGTIRILRPADCKRSTVQAGYDILEIFWEEND